MTAILERWRDADRLSPLDVHAARAWGRIAGEDDPDVLLAAALVSHAVSAGHVCLDLDRVAASATDEPTGGGRAAEGTPASALAVPDAAAWIRTLRSSPLVHGDVEARTAAGEAVRPLVLDEHGRLYARRYWEYQETLAAAIRARLGGAAVAPIDEAVLDAGLDRLFAPGDAAGEPDRQRAAAEGAVRSAFFVMSGGPGTGKTSTVVRILVLLVEQARARGASPPRIALLAPTGKAAAQLQASVVGRLAELDCAPEVRAAIPQTASTLHRALGAGGRPMRYRRGPERPLDDDVVIVDEASMVDLATMARLVAAMRPAARLILLGDRDQLASVEAGAVLGDIAGAADPAAAAARPIVQLERSHRFAATSDLGALVGAVNAGDADRVLELLDDPARPAVRRLESGDADALVAAVHAGYGPFAEATTAEARLEALERFRVLCAHRRGPRGVRALCLLAERLLAEQGAIVPDGLWYAGRPIGVVRNDPQSGLYNGDVGLVAEAPGDDALRVLFRAPDGRTRWISPLRVRDAETIFAMSVHKAQGSELDRVLVVLPDEASPVVTRELLYTAVSRARREVIVSASREVVAQALARRVQRASGLADAIWGGLSPRTPPRDR